MFLGSRKAFNIDAKRLSTKHSRPTKNKHFGLPMGKKGEQQKRGGNERERNQGQEKQIETVATLRGIQCV